MKPCPWCEDKGVVPKILGYDDGVALDPFGRRVGLVRMGTGPCCVCGGKGDVTIDRYYELSTRWTTMPA